MDIGFETQPFEIVQQCRFVLRTTASAIVIFDAQHHLSSKRPGHAPDMHRIHEMPEMHVPRWRGRKSRAPTGRSGQTL